MVLLALAILAALYAQSKGQQNFTVQPPFDNMETSKDATKGSEWMSLTRDEYSSDVRFISSSGRVFYRQPLRLIDPVSSKALSFNTTFVFCIRTFPGEDAPADGMTFFMVPNVSALPSTTNGGYLGLFSSTTNGNSSNQALAVEFDTHQNDATTGFMDIDPEADHIGLDINGVVSVANTTLGGTDLSLLQNRRFQAWINYDRDLQKLDVWMSINGSGRNNTPILSYQNLDLSTIIADKMYLGFSGATGLPWLETHRVFSWSFTASSYTPRKNATSKIVASVFGVLIVSLFAGAVWLIWRRWFRSRRRNGSLNGVNLEVKSFSYKELYSATRGFSSKEMLGKGGSGSVYKGVLPHTGSIVAVKALCDTKTPKLAESQFLAELSVISRVRHQNLVALRGWCHEKNKLLLVYELMPNGSLDHVLFSEDRGIVLSWTQRRHIMKGVAEGLAYLHEGLERRIIHRDVKAANVLLDEKMGAKLGDFGLAKLLENGKGAQTMTRAGTIGYMAPELAYTGRATETSDVYSFAILVLEIVCGRPALDTTLGFESCDGEDYRLVLLDWVWRMHEVGNLVEAVDPRITEGEDFSMEQALMFIRLGILCSFPDARSRPTMRKCCQVMDGDVELPCLPKMRPRAVYIDLFGESSGTTASGITITNSSS